MQEAFTQLLQQPQGFDASRGSLGAYLAGIARHQLLARWREARRFVALLDSEEDDDALAVDEGEPPLLRQQSSEQLWAALRRLPWSQREALVLVDLQERPYQEAAQIAGVSTEVLRSRLHRARQRLAALLGDCP